MRIPAAIILLCTYVYITVKAYEAIPCYRPPRVLYLTVSSSFSNTSKSEIVRAMSAWNKALGVDAFVHNGYSKSIDRVPSGYQTITPSTAMKSIGDTRITMGYGQLGWVTHDVDIRLNEVVIVHPSTFYNVVLHELGHAMGIDHNLVAGSIMNHSITMGANGFALYEQRHKLSPDDVYGVWMNIK